MDILPKSFRAANKQCFSATGIGKLTVDLPNGIGSSKLELTEVLYYPEVRYTLVSVGNLDEKGYRLTFGAESVLSLTPVINKWKRYLKIIEAFTVLSMILK